MRLGDESLLVGVAIALLGLVAALDPLACSHVAALDPLACSDVEARVSCGGFTASSCQDMACCWDASPTATVPCFFAANGVPVKKVCGEKKLRTKTSRSTFKDGS